MNQAMLYIEKLGAPVVALAEAGKVLMGMSRLSNHKVRCALLISRDEDKAKRANGKWIQDPGDKAASNPLAPELSV